MRKLGYFQKGVLKAAALYILAWLMLTGCSEIPVVTAIPAASDSVPAAPSATWTFVPPALAPSATVSLPVEITPAAAALPEICSPLAGYDSSELAGLVVNPYHPPKPGSDDPHQGLDLGVVDAVQGFAVSGNPVQTVLAGKVAGVTADRFPYGNMLMIETRLDQTAPLFEPVLQLPTPNPSRLPRGALTCPEMTALPPLADAPRSLYILYAHMLNPPTASVGDLVSCGQEIGVVGQSGNALNPHIHVEVRVGPAGQTFASMAHYDPSATYSEMDAYCTWRVSGVFQAIDPGCLWGSCANP